MTDTHLSILPMKASTPHKTCAPAGHGPRPTIAAFLHSNHRISGFERQMSNRKRIHFFSETRDLVASNARLFDFLWTAAVGLWNLRWQADGLTRALGKYDDVELKHRLMAGSRIFGANLKGVCMDASWDENQERLATIALTLGIANFEGWLAALVHLLHQSRKPKAKQFGERVKLCSDLQHPDRFEDAVALLIGNPSQLSTACFSPPLVRRWKREIQAVPNLLRVLRHYKDLRNRLAHGGGVADQHTEESFAAMRNLSAADIGTSEFPVTIPVQSGAPLRLSLRGVVAVTDVMLRLAAAIDARLSTAAASDEILESRWRSVFGARKEMLPFDTGKRRKRVRSFIVKIGLPPPEDPDAMLAWLSSRKLVRF